jgi:hypothetical protein
MYKSFTNRCQDVNISLKWILLDAVEKLRKACHVCPSARNNSDSHWKNFHEIWYLNIFRKSVEKMNVSLKSGMNNGYCNGDQCTFMKISHWILLRIRNAAYKSRGEIQNIYFIFNIFFFEHHPVNETIWNYVVQPDRPQITTHRVIRNDCRGFNNLSYTIHLRQEYVVAPMD